ncbi:MAG: hypothetical protein IPJ98_31100 [Bryobacterales bacterium]|nr:hypothetical protein [Bryobacterales bacterium]
MKRLSSSFGLAGRFSGLHSEFARVEVETSGCTFVAVVDNGPQITTSPFQVPLARPDGSIQDLSIMLSGPNGSHATIRISPVEDFDEVDFVLISAIVPFPINHYQFITVSSTSLAAPAVAAGAGGAGSD